MNPKKTLAFQFLMLFLTLLALYIGIRLWSIGPLKEKLISQRESIINLSLSELQSIIISGNFEEPKVMIGAIAQHYRGRFSILRIAILDTKGRILSSTEGDTKNVAEHTPEVLNSLNARNNMFYFSDKDNALNFLVSDPTVNASRGGILISFSVSDLNNTINTMAFRTTIVAFVVILLLFIFEIIRFHSLATTCTELQKGFSLLKDGIHSFDPNSGKKGPNSQLITDFRNAVIAEKERDNERNKLIEKSKAIAVIKDKEQLFSVLFNEMEALLGVDKQIAMEIDDETLVIAAERGHGASLIAPGEKYSACEDVFNEVLEFGRPLTIEEPSEIRLNLNYMTIIAQSGYSVLFPLTLGNEVVGILHVSRSREKGRLSPSEIEKGMILIGGASIALLHETFPDDSFIPHNTNRNECIAVKPFGELKRMSASSIFIGVDKHGAWAEWFHLGSESGTDATFICVSSPNSRLKGVLRHKMDGILAVTSRLKRQIGNLSLFSLSAITKMPNGSEKEKLVELFKTNPFSLEGIDALIKSSLGNEAAAVSIDIFRFDTKRMIIRSLSNNFSLFAIDNRWTALIDNFPAAIKKETVYALLPHDIIHKDDLSTGFMQDDLTTFLTNMRIKASVEEAILSKIAAPAALAVVVS